MGNFEFVTKFLIQFHTSSAHWKQNFAKQDCIYSGERERKRDREKVGESERLINTIDIDGVTLAGVRALEERTAAQQSKLDALERENSRMKREQEALQARLEKLEAALRQLP